jgi:hypothetical protein
VSSLNPDSTEPQRAGWIPKAFGATADAAGISALLLNGGDAFVLTAGVGAMAAGIYILWRSWRGLVDMTLLAGVAIAVLGAAVTGYTLADSKSGSESSAITTELGSPASQESASPPSNEPSSPPTTEAHPDSTTSTSSATVIQPVDAVALVDLDPIGDVEPNLNRESTTMNGVNYSDAIRVNSCWDYPNEVEFSLLGDFKRLTATAGLHDTVEEPDVPRHFVIEAINPGGETSILLNETVTYGRTIPVDIRLDGVQRLRLAISTSEQDYCFDGEYAGTWAEPVLSR